MILCIFYKQINLEF